VNEKGAEGLRMEQLPDVIHFHVFNVIGIPYSRKRRGPSDALSCSRHSRLSFAGCAASRVNLVRCWRYGMNDMRDRWLACEMSGPGAACGAETTTSRPMPLPAELKNVPVGWRCYKYGAPNGAFPTGANCTAKAQFACKLRVTSSVSSVVSSFPWLRLSKFFGSLRFHCLSEPAGRPDPVKMTACYNA
jgi:hypothetical protein